MRNRDVNVFITCLLYNTFSSKSNKSSVVSCSLFENCSGYSSLSSGKSCSLFDNITTSDNTDLGSENDPIYFLVLRI